MLDLTKNVYTFYQICSLKINENINLKNNNKKLSQKIK